MGTEKKADDSEEIQILEDISESEEIDRRIEELMVPEEDGNGKKKKKKHRTGHRTSEGGFHPVRHFREFSRKYKIVTVLLLAAVVLFRFSRMSGGKEDMGIPVAVMPPAKQDVQEKLAISGPISGADSVDVVSDTHVEITAMNVKEDDAITKEQVLAVVGSADLEREVQIAQNTYDLAVANKQEKGKEAVLGYEKIVQDFQKASLDHNRSSQLFAAGDISQMELETSTNALNGARKQIKGYTVENGRGIADPSYGTQVRNATFDLEKKREKLDNTQIRSTIDDTVVRVNSKVDQFVDKVEDDKPILSIENLGRLEPEIRVSEFSIGKVKVGRMAAITANILDGETAEGEIIKISPTDEEKGGDSTERVIPTTIRVDGGSSKLIAGITAKAELLIRGVRDVFVVPTSALFDDGKVTYIAIMQDIKVKRMPVTMGVDGDVVVEVIPADGTVLEEGMQVITNPNPHLVDGAAVSITQQQETLYEQVDGVFAQGQQSAGRCP